MNKQLIVRDEIEINASLNNVWDVLTLAKYYQQWDELPDNFEKDSLSIGDKLEWEGQAKMTVVQCDANNILKMSLFLPKVDLDPSAYDISYRYNLMALNGKTILIFEIGDFSPLPDAESYYDQTLIFVDVAKKTIKQLAESI